jgi:UTP--glucose-1-phosphate uridylyltransferase
MPRSWCLYLPGRCLHNVPSAPGTHPLHHQNRRIPPTFTYTPLDRDPYKPYEDMQHPALREQNPKPNPQTRAPANAMPSKLPTSVAQKSLSGAELTMLMNYDKAFENTSTSVAASQMRNALNNLADTVSDPEQKKVTCTSANL